MADSNEFSNDPGTSRREFLKNAGRVAASSALVTGVVPRIYAS